MSKLKVGTLFSGIGSFEWALERLKIEYDVVFACDNGDVNIDVENYDELLAKSKKMSTIAEMREFEKDLYSSTKKTNFVLNM